MKELIAIQNELKAPKGQTNAFGKYKYRSCEDILEAVKPLCVKHNCLLTISDEMIMLGNRFYVKAKAQLIKHEDDSNKVSDICEVSAYAREAESKKGMDEAQITGSASSYARKYALNGLFCIDDTKDADTQDNTSQPSSERKKTTEKGTSTEDLNLEASANAHIDAQDWNEVKKAAMKKQTHEASFAKNVLSGAIK